MSTEVDPSASVLAENPSVLLVPPVRTNGRRRSAAVMANSKEDMEKEPVLAKSNGQEHFTIKGNEHILIAACGIQGWRKMNEDAHCLVLRDASVSLDVSRVPARIGSVSLPDSNSRPHSPAPIQQSSSESCSPAASQSPAASPYASAAQSPDAKPREGLISLEGTSLLAMLGIFDGHNGRAAADYAAACMPRIMAHHVSECTDPKNTQAISDAVKSAFHECDDDMRAQGVGASGCTAACVVVTSDYVLLCSAGDCRLSAVGRDGTVVASIEADHNPSKNDEEAQRLKELGVEVSNGRVLGRLAVSRALGDFAFKPEDKLRHEYPVLATPTVTAVPKDQVDFVVAGCDGVWELNTMSQVIATVAACRDNIDSAVTKVVRSSCSIVRPLNPLTGQMQPGNDNITFGALFFQSGASPPSRDTNTSTE